MKYPAAGLSTGVLLSSTGPMVQYEGWLVAKCTTNNHMSETVRKGKESTPNPVDPHVTTSILRPLWHLAVEPWLGPSSSAHMEEVVNPLLSLLPREGSHLIQQLVCQAVLACPCLGRWTACDVDRVPRVVVLWVFGV